MHPRYFFHRHTQFLLTIYLYFYRYASMNINQMKQAASRAGTLMKALSNETRLMLLCQIGEGEKSVSELVDALEMRPASISQQLALLRKDSLVSTRRDGQTIYYSLDGDEAKNIIAVLYELYCKDVEDE